MQQTTYKFDPRLIRLVDIESVERVHHINGVDLEVEEDHTFTLSNGLLSHNSAAKSIQGGRGDNPFIGSFPLKGKILNVRDKEVGRVLGLDKKKEKEQAGKKAAPNEIQKIMSILGLNIGEKVTFNDFPDGEWIELKVNGKTVIVNEFDSIQVDGEWIKVSSLM